ncbi:MULTISPECIES: hypothetical protein [unclassified Acinetobacter]|uniref:hypothetical protein n=1 Tax=unclassified Acinetobacter TaxID=196816 RepID=UPI0015D29183|nr:MULTISPECIES: hypothetical protein [unclassified Acinetobacter]
MATNKKQVRIHISYDTALKIQVWANTQGLTLPQACSAICESFTDKENVVIDKLDQIIDLLTDQ